MDNDRDISTKEGLEPGGIEGPFDEKDRPKDLKSLEEARMQAQFYLDLMTHDITNKHQMMLMNLEMLRTSQFIHDRERLYISSCVRQLGRAMDTIRSVKTIADVGIGAIETESVDLVEAIREGMESLESYHPYLRSRLDLAIPKGPVMVQADAKLFLVIYHLLNNAITHNSSNEPIVRIDLVEGEKDLTLFIQDNGPGIPKDVIDGLKGLTVRNVRKAQGRGLGLSLIIVLINAYQGSFQIENNDDGIGSTAMVRLRKASSN